MKVFCIAGARPNFMKIGPILRALRKEGIESKLIHTGQHYDAIMSDVFFKELEIPTPDISLNVGSGSHAKQTADIMIRYEEILQNEKPDLTLVVGDVNSTLACSIASAKMNIPIAHVEAGLRSFDRGMPEEVNRLVTDAVSQYLFTTEKSGTENLLREGKTADQIFFVGNVMIDSLISVLPKINSEVLLKKFGMNSKQFALMTLHRPSNVDDRESLMRIADLLKSVQSKIRVLFAVHPRTRGNIKKFGLEDLFEFPNVILTEPLGYLDFIGLLRESKLVITDSGGLQEEAAFLKIPCLTMRENTERPVTIEIGSNTLVGSSSKDILPLVERVLINTYKQGEIPPLWDGRASERIVQTLRNLN